MALENLDGESSDESMLPATFTCQTEKSDADIIIDTACDAIDGISQREFESSDDH
jgi:hypothetical protein